MNFYDIFVRNAFANFGNILREVTYSPVIGGFSSTKGNSAFDYSDYYPDENSASEIMQLFTIGEYYFTNVALSMYFLVVYATFLYDPASTNDLRNQS